MRARRSVPLLLQFLDILRLVDDQRLPALLHQRRQVRRSDVVVHDDDISSQFRRRHGLLAAQNLRGQLGPPLRHFARPVGPQRRSAHNDSGRIERDDGLETLAAVVNHDAVRYEVARRLGAHDVVDVSLAVGHDRNDLVFLRNEQDFLAPAHAAVEVQVSTCASVVLLMLLLGLDFQVRPVVMCPDLIEVVHLFVLAQMASEMLFGDQDVLVDPSVRIPRVPPPLLPS